jgi:hypothetical protein
MPTRIDGELFEAARAAGELQSRSAAQQLDHWARLGRELEASPSVTHETIEAVLAGEQPYDALDDREQAVIRVAWEELIEGRIEKLDFEKELDATGATWAEADAAGKTVIRSPQPGT